MAVEKEFFDVKYKEGSLDAKTAQLILFAVCMSHGYERGANLHLGKARECGASDDEILEAVVYGMRPPAALARNVARNLSVKGL